MGETRVFLKSKTKVDRKRMSKSRYSTNVQARFVRREKSLLRNFLDRKERYFDFLSFEGKRIDFGANKLKLRPFESRPFCDKMRPFFTISASTFWKIRPDVHTDIHTYRHTYRQTYIHIYNFIYSRIFGISYLHNYTR